MGFYNFALSVSLFFFALGCWWRCEDKLSPRAFVTVYVWLTVVYLTHFQSYALLTVSLTFLGIFLYVYEALESPRRAVGCADKIHIALFGFHAPRICNPADLLSCETRGRGFP